MPKVKVNDIVYDSFHSHRKHGKVIKVTKKYFTVQYTNNRQDIYGDDRQTFVVEKYPPLPKRTKNNIHELLEYAIRMRASELWHQNDVIGEPWEDRYTDIARFEILQALKEGTMDEL